MTSSTTRTHGIKLNPLFTGSPSGERYHARVPIDWDVRYHPTRSAEIADIPLLSSHLSQFATNPPLPKLHLVCDLLSPEWEIVARNPTGVTVQDVLEAIYETLHRLLRMHEWESMSVKQRSRIEDIHRARCLTSLNPRAHTFRGGPPSGLSALNDHVCWTDLVGQEEREVGGGPHAVTRFQTPSRH
ncbi:hypothetical protein EDB19DRAFT_129217 [Suillus lakei]|nr:hypothetical protein EDB19DRAFT_129217 [Suillus lakei]